MSDRVFTLIPDTNEILYYRNLKIFYNKKIYNNNNLIIDEDGEFIMIFLGDYLIKANNLISLKNNLKNFFTIITNRFNNRKHIYKKNNIWHFTI